MAGQAGVAAGADEAVVVSFKVSDTRLTPYLERRSKGVLDRR